MFKIIKNFFYPPYLHKFDIKAIKPDDTICIIGNIHDNKSIISDILYTINLLNGQQFYHDCVVISKDTSFYKNFIPFCKIQRCSNDFKCVNLYVPRKLYNKDFFIHEITDEFELTTINWKKTKNNLKLISLPYKLFNFDNNDKPSYIITDSSEESIKYILKNFPVFENLSKSYVIGTHIIIDVNNNVLYSYSVSSHPDFKLCNTSFWLI